MYYYAEGIEDEICLGEIFKERVKIGCLIYMELNNREIYIWSRLFENFEIYTLLYIHFSDLTFFVFALGVNVSI